MKKVKSFNEFINESVWADIYDRSTGDTVRKEDDFNPEYIDFGPETTVYWACDALEENDVAKRYYFEDIKGFNKNGWRLPTEEEVKQVDFSKQNVRIYWAKGYMNIVFPEGTLRIKTTDIYYGFHMWTDNHTYESETFEIVYGYDNMHNFDIHNCNKFSNRLYVFLVKDKK